MFSDSLFYEGSAFSLADSIAIAAMLNCCQATGSGYFDAIRLRHAFGTRSIINGNDITTTAELMGHTTSRTAAEHYVHLAGHHQHLADAIRRVNGRRSDS